MKTKLRLTTIIMLLAFFTNVMNAQVPVFSSSMTVTPFGTVDSPDNESAANAIDGDVNTKFLNFTGNVDGTGFDVDMGGNSAIASMIEITYGNDAPERDPSAVRILGSNDGTTYVVLDSVKTLGCDYGRNETRSYAFDNTEAYSFYRIHFYSKCNEGEALFQIMEVQLYDLDGRVPIIAKGMAVFHLGDAASSWGDDEHPYAAFDGSIDTKFLDQTRGTNASGFTIDLNGLSATATSMAYITANDASERNPADYEILGSNDGSTFTSITTGTFTPTTNFGEEVSVSFDNSTAYTYYQVSFSSTQGDVEPLQLAELQLYGDVAGTQGASKNLSALDIYPIVNPGFKDLNGNYDENVNKAFDNNPDTKWITPKGDGLGVILDLDANSIVAKALRLTTANDTWQRDPLECRISGSNDGYNYTEINLITIPENMDRRSTIDFPLANDVSYSLYKIEFTSLGTDNLFQIMGIDLVHDGNVTTALERPYVFKPGMTVTPVGPSFDWGEFMGITESPDKVFDNNRNTKFFNAADANSGTVGFTVDLDIYSVAADRLELVTANDDPGRDPFSYEVYGSNDNVNYTLIGSGDVAQNMDRFSKTTYELDNTTSYSYYRLTFPTRHDMNKPFQIAEANLCYSGTVTDMTSKKLFLTEEFTVTAFESVQSSEEEGVENAVDNDVLTKWLDTNGGAQGSGFDVVFENAVVASSLVYVTGNDAPGRDASAVTVYGSADGVDFTELSQITIPASNARGYQRIFEIDNHKAYTHYRVSFAGTNGDALFQTMDIQLIRGEEIASYTVNFNVKDTDNAALSGATVDFNGTTVTTDASGVASFSDVEAVSDAAYTVSLTDYETETGTVSVVDQDVTVDVALVSTVGVSDSDLTQISIYPNPSNGELYLQMSGDNTQKTVSVYTIEGSMIQSVQTQDDQFKLDLSSQAAGMYLITISSENQHVNKRIVLE